MTALTVENLGAALITIVALHQPIVVMGVIRCSQCDVRIESEPCATVNIANAALGRA